MCSLADARVLSGVEDAIGRGRLRAGSSGLALTVGAPLALGVVTVLHPNVADDDVYMSLRGRVSPWLAVHLAQLVLIPLVAAAVWLLVDRLEPNAARASRIALVPFVAFYSAYDAAVGLATGVLVLQDADPAVVQRYWDERTALDGPVFSVALAGSVAWLAALLFAALAAHRAAAGRMPVALLALAGVALAVDHPFPTGTIAMVALALAAFTLARRAGRPN